MLNTSPLNVPAEILATLVEISEEINSSLDLDEVLQKTATLVKRLVDFEIFGVMLLDESTQRLYHRFTIGYGEQASKDWQIPLGQGITGTAAATGRAVRVGDVREDPRYINIIDSVRSELVVPLVVKGQSIGVLDIQSTQVDYFTRDQQSVLTLMASRLAVAIENARLFERVRSQADTLRVLNEVGREANSILDVEELLRRAAELVKRVINYQILGILLYDEATNVFRHRLRDFFDFDYQVECFVPAPKRKYGYFSLPVLIGDTFVARMDSKADRKNKMLIIHNLHFEEVGLNGDMIQKLIDTLKEFILFNQCRAVTFARCNRPDYLNAIESAF